MAAVSLFRGTSMTAVTLCETKNYVAWAKAGKVFVTKVHQVLMLISRLVSLVLRLFYSKLDAAN